MCTQLIIKYTTRSGIFPMLEVDEVVCRGGGMLRARVGFSPGQDFINIF